MCLKLDNFPHDLRDPDNLMIAELFGVQYTFACEMPVVLLFWQVYNTLSVQYPLGDFIFRLDLSFKLKF